MDRIQTGSHVLDAALAGGIAPGSALLVSGEEGAGATEFAMTLLCTAAQRNHGSKARFVSALRSASRVVRELQALFEERARPIDVRVAGSADVLKDMGGVFADLTAGDVLVIESADALAAHADEGALMDFWHALADAADEAGVLVMLLHSPGTLPRPLEAALAETADAVLDFHWLDGGQSRRRVLSIPKLRGLAPVLDGEQVPVFEVALQRGSGFVLSRQKTVL